MRVVNTKTGKVHECKDGIDVKLAIYTVEAENAAA